MSRSGPRQRAVFRLPWISVVFPFLLFICVTPLATFRSWLLWLYMVPLLALVYVVVTRTVADATAIATRGLIGRRRVQWDDLDGFEFQGPRWALAVTQTGEKFRLPMVRPRDLPVLAQVSGGRLTLSTPRPAESTEPATDTTGTVDPTDTVDIVDPTDTVDPTGPIGSVDTTKVAAAGDVQPFPGVQPGGIRPAEDVRRTSTGRPAESTDILVPTVIGPAQPVGGEEPERTPVADEVATGATLAGASTAVEPGSAPVDPVAGPAAPRP